MVGIVKQHYGRHSFKTMKRLLNIWKRSATEFSEEYPSLLQDESSVNQSPAAGIKSFVNDGFGKFSDYRKNSSLENIERIWNKSEIFFVVDWQMSDSF
jgi:hypothetical protein